MAASFTSFVHLSISVLNRLVNSSGVPPAGSAPRLQLEKLRYRLGRSAEATRPVAERAVVLPRNHAGPASRASRQEVSQKVLVSSIARRNADVEMQHFFANPKLFVKRDGRIVAVVGLNVDDPGATPSSDLAQVLDEGGRDVPPTML